MYHPIMLHAASFLIASAQAMLVIKVPEPAAIPELLACVLGVGYGAWRLRKGRSDSQR